MKSISCAILTLLFCFAAAAEAQTTSDNGEVLIPKTNLEAFQDQPGKVVIKGISRIGSIGGTNGRIEIQVREVKNPGSSLKVKGLLISINESGERRPNSSRSFIEYDELDNLIKGIEYIGKLDRPVTTLQSFEATYKTKDDFAVTVFSGFNGDLQVNLSVGGLEPKTIYTSFSSLTDLNSKLQQAKSVLDDLK